MADFGYCSMKGAPCVSIKLLNSFIPWLPRPACSIEKLGVGIGLLLMLLCLLVIVNKGGEEEKSSALAGSRTRIYCLEGNNANRYTTNACLSNLANYSLSPC